MIIETDLLPDILLAHKKLMTEVGIHRFFLDRLLPVGASESMDCPIVGVGLDTIHPQVGTQIWFFGRDELTGSSCEV